MIIAVDFDGTLCDDIFPEIGAPHIALIQRLIDYRKSSPAHKLILWTCRCDDALQNAVDWCKSFGLEFDAINENVPENIAKYKTNSRKVFADLYIEDKAVDWKIFSEVGASFDNK